MSDYPDTSLDWARFPARTVSTSVDLYRIHRNDKVFAWFGGRPIFRFDPPASRSSQFGTCYFSYAPIGAFMETLGRTRIVNYNTEIEVRALTATRLASERRVADLTSRRAAEFGIDNAYSASADYRPSQELAALLFDAGFEGVRYKIRHDPAQGLEALALFHSAPGEHPELFATQKASPIPIDVIELAEREFGITVQSTTTLP